MNNNGINDLRKSSFTGVLFVFLDGPFPVLKKKVVAVGHFQKSKFTNNVFMGLLRHKNRQKSRFGGQKQAQTDEAILRDKVPAFPVTFSSYRPIANRLSCSPSQTFSAFPFLPPFASPALPAASVCQHWSTSNPLPKPLLSVCPFLAAACWRLPAAVYRLRLAWAASLRKLLTTCVI